MRLINIIISILIFIQVVPASESVQSEHLQIQLISEVTAISQGTPFNIAVRFQLEDHWHVYWKNPGDAGLQPEFEWDVPDGFRVVEMQWPYPEKIMVGGLANYGYENEVLLITEVVPPTDLKTNTNITIRLHAEWLICKEECIPGEADLEISLPVTTGSVLPDERWIQKFSGTRDRLPLVNSDWQITASIADTLLFLDLKNPDWYHPDLNKVTFFPEQGEVINHASDQILNQTEYGYRLKIPLNDMRGTDPDSISGVLVSDEGWRGSASEQALWFRAAVTKKALESSKEPDGVLLALLFAFLGGIILNVMPCVLPVLSLKILNFVQQSGDDRKKILVHGIIFTLGVLLSFIALAVILILLRTGGEQLGWGFQLQSPAFLVVLTAFLFMFGLNLFGVFEIGTSVMATGQKSASRHGWAGAFMSGVTATVVATPCTAPFMGSALGFALTQSNIVSLLIFGSLGLGMAFPYLLLSANPGLLRFLPKPGAWMESLKQFMGFLLMATVIWLIWVFGIQTDNGSVIILLSVLLCVSIGAWIIGRWAQLHLAKWRRVSVRMFATGIISASIIFAMANISEAEKKQINSGTESEIIWQNYSAEAVNQALQSGRPVFIDFTAAWCLSCQVNERVAFGSQEVLAALKKQNFVMLKADWTTRNEKITQALASYGRNSVPLYVIHTDPDLSKKVILPEILSPSIVLNALKGVEK